MTPSAIIALIKDLVILVAIGLVAYFLITYGKDIVKLSDVQGLQKQLLANASTQAKWQKESSDADTQRASDLQKIAANLATQRPPVFLRGAPSSCPVSADPAKAPAQPAANRPADAGAGADLRPQFNAFEARYETVIADCRAAINKWPAQP